MGILTPAWLKKSEATHKLTDQSKIERAAVEGYDVFVRNEAVNLLENKGMLYRFATNTNENPQVRASACIRIIDLNYFDQRVQMECANQALKLGIFPLNQGDFLKSFFDRITSPEVLSSLNAKQCTCSIGQMFPEIYIEHAIPMASQYPEYRRSLIDCASSLISKIGYEPQAYKLLEIPGICDELKIRIINKILINDVDFSEDIRNNIKESINSICDAEALLLYSSWFGKIKFTDIDEAYIRRCIEIIKAHPEKLNKLSKSFKKLNDRYSCHEDYFTHEDKGGYHIDSVNKYHYSSTDCHDDNIPQKKVNGGWHRDGREGPEHEDRNAGRVDRHIFDNFKPYFETKDKK